MGDPNPFFSPLDIEQRSDEGSKIERVAERYTGGNTGLSSFLAYFRHFEANVSYYGNEAEVGDGGKTFLYEEGGENN